MAETLPSRFAGVLRLRLLVGYLGERAQFGWWPTSFFEPSSRLFLEPVFARTLLTAQYHGVLEAARRFHDENLSAGAFHLFRLPEEMEEDLHTLVQAEKDACLDKDSALEALTTAACGLKRNAVGPVSIGSANEVMMSAKLQEIAAIYRASFASNLQAFPYLLQ